MAVMAVAPALAQDARTAAKPDQASVDSAIPANGDKLLAPKWVREPIGGPKSNKFLRVADTRGMGETVPALLALGVSDKKAIVLLVQGHNPKVIEDARRELSGLIIVYGYERIALVIGDGPEDTAYIYSKGHKVITLQNIDKAEDRDIAFDSNVKRLYERDVVPALNVSSSPAPGK